MKLLTPLSNRTRHEHHDAKPGVRVAPAKAKTKAATGLAPQDHVSRACLCRASVEGRIAVLSFPLLLYRSSLLECQGVQLVDDLQQHKNTNV